MGKGAIGGLVFTNAHQFQPAERLDFAAVDGQAFHPGVKAAVNRLVFDEELVFHFAADEVDLAAIACLAQIGRAAGAAIDDDAVIRAVGEIRGRMVRRVVGVAKRDTVDGHVVLAVLEPAQHNLGIAKADAVAAARQERGAGRQQNDLAVVGGRGDRVFDDRARHDRLRFKGMDRRGDRRGLVYLGAGDDDVVGVADGVVGGVGGRSGCICGKGGRCTEAQRDRGSVKRRAADHVARHVIPLLSRNSSRGALTNACDSYVAK